MFKNTSPRLLALLQALLVTFLWSTSWVLIKIGLEDIPALTFAGLRYFLAFLVLLPFALRAPHRASLRGLSAAQWGRLALLGLLFYALTQGSQFLSLFYLPAVTVNLILSLTSIPVALLGALLLREHSTLAQWGGIALATLGAVAFFYPAAFAPAELIGLAIGFGGMLTNALSTILGREVNRAGTLDPLTVTVVSMGIGSAALLAAGVAVQGWPHLQPVHWAIVAWLAVVNSALAFTLWNRSLRVLSAMESSVINNTMMIQIPVLAVIFLGESMSLQAVGGLALAAIGTLVVQLRGQPAAD